MREGCSSEPTGANGIGRRFLVSAVVAGVAALTAVATSVPASAAVAAPDPASSGALAVTVRAQSWIAQGQSLPFFASVLRAIGAPVTSDNLKVMEAWARAEGSRSAYNPWNTTQRAPGAVYGSNAVTSFASADSAVTALRNQLLSIYKDVVAGFVASNPSRTIAAIVASPWASGHYYGQDDYRRSTIWRVYVTLPATGWEVSAIEARVPGKVSITQLRRVKRRVHVRWARPARNGSAIRRYQVIIRRHDAVARQWYRLAKISTGRKARKATWKNLTPGDQYRVRVRARNGLGFGRWSKRLHFVA